MLTLMNWRCKKKMCKQWETVRRLLLYIDVIKSALAMTSIHMQEFPFNCFFKEVSDWNHGVMWLIGLYFSSWRLSTNHPKLSVNRINLMELKSVVTYILSVLVRVPHVHLDASCCSNEWHFLSNSNCQLLGIADAFSLVYYLPFTSYPF